MSGPIELSLPDILYDLMATTLKANISNAAKVMIVPNNRPSEKSFSPGCFTTKYVPNTKNTVQNMALVILIFVIFFI